MNNKLGDMWKPFYLGVLANLSNHIIDKVNSTIEDNLYKEMHVHIFTRIRGDIRSIARANICNVKVSHETKYAIESNIKNILKQK